jgi:hypothetical protein
MGFQQKKNLQFYTVSQTEESGLEDSSCPYWWQVAQQSAPGDRPLIPSSCTVSVGLWHENECVQAGKSWVRDHMR